MSRFEPFLSRIEATGIATAVGQSVMLTAFLSGVHLLGLTLVVGGALVTSLRLVGVVFPQHAAADVTAAARRGIQVGLALSIATGLLLVSPRIASAATNTIFQIKMLLLLLASTFHWTIYRNTILDRGHQRRHPGLVGALGLALWYGVALAGCAFLLLE